MKEKINKVGNIIDDLVDFPKLAKNMKSKILKVAFGSIEMFDGWAFKTALTELIDLVPDKFHPMVEAYLDAVIAKDYVTVKETTADVLNILIDIPKMDEQEEKAVYVAVLSAIMSVVPMLLKKEQAA